MDSAGRVKTDAILGHGDKKVFSQYTDLIERPHDASELAKPSEEEINDVTARTRAALEKIVNSMSPSFASFHLSLTMHTSVPLFLTLTLTLFNPLHLFTLLQQRFKQPNPLHL